MRIHLITLLVFLFTVCLILLAYHFGEFSSVSDSSASSPALRRSYAGIDESPSILIEQLRSPLVVSRRTAAERLAMLGNSAREAVPALADALRDEDSAVRRTAAHALGEIGPAAQSAVPALTQAMSDADQGVLQEAASAVRRIEGPVRKPETDELQ